METALDRFWELVQGAMALDPKAFQLIETLPGGVQVSFYVLLLAGFSQAIAQGIVLFLNQVRPVRFFLSLGVAAILFVISTAFWMMSIWLVSHLFYGANTSFLTIFRVLGLAYAPLLWSFLVAMPYLGVPIGAVLSIWSLLSFVRGFDVVTGLGRWSALWCAILGWVVFQILQRTIGRPAAALGKWVSNSVAGTPLVTDMRGLEQLVQSSFGESVAASRDDGSNDRGTLG